MTTQPYRIPEGWSERAAEIVWDGWIAAMRGEERPSRRVPNIKPYGPRGRSLKRYFDEAKDAQDPFPLPDNIGATWGYCGGGYASVSWDSHAHQLRAWAAVGAPISVAPDPSVRFVIVAALNRGELTEDVAAQALGVDVAEVRRLAEEARDNTGSLPADTVKALRWLADEATFSDVGLCDAETIAAGRLLRMVANQIDRIERSGS